MNIYDGYARTKGWLDLFACSPAEAIYYEAELRGLVAAGRTVLEIGFGSGSFLRWARDRGAEIHGIEVQDELVRAATAAGFSAYGSMGELLPEREGRFDAVVAFDVIEHLDHDEIRSTLNAVSRLLKPDGRLLIRVPNGMSPFSGFGQNGDITHRTTLTPFKLQQLCAGQNMAVAEFANRRRSPRSRSPAVRLTKWAQALVRDLANFAIARIYGLQTTVLDPELVVILRRDSGK